jgi:putative sterol carrier protein
VSKFLTEEWARDVTTALNNHEGFKNAIGAAELSAQFVTHEGPDGDVNFYLKAAGGIANQAIGTIDDPDVTVTMSYDTATQVSKGEVNVQSAFMTGKIKVAGNLAKLMMHQTALQQWASVGTSLDVEY